MEERKVIAEIEALLSKQMQDLRKELTLELVVSYGQRHKRIRELVERIGRNQNGQ